MQERRKSPTPVRTRGRRYRSRPGRAMLATRLAILAVSFGLPGHGAHAAEPIKPIPEQVEVSPEKAALGRDLFHDPRLSRDDTVSCASCHVLSAGGADGRKVSIGIEGQPGLINSPTVFNVGLNFKQFWDGRAGTLEQQIDDPVQSPLEMGSLWPDVVAKLYQRRQNYPKLLQGPLLRTASAATASGTRLPNS